MSVIILYHSSFNSFEVRSLWVITVIEMYCMVATAAFGILQNLKFWNVRTLEFRDLDFGLWNLWICGISLWHYVACIEIHCAVYNLLALSFALSFFALPSPFLCRLLFLAGAVHQDSDALLLVYYATLLSFVGALVTPWHHDTDTVPLCVCLPWNSSKVSWCGMGEWCLCGETVCGGTLWSVDVACVVEM